MSLYYTMFTPYGGTKPVSLGTNPVSIEKKMVNRGAEPSLCMRLRRNGRNPKFI